MRNGYNPYDSYEAMRRANDTVEPDFPAPTDTGGIEVVEHVLPSRSVEGTVTAWVAQVITR